MCLCSVCCVFKRYLCSKVCVLSQLEFFPGVGQVCVVCVITVKMWCYLTVNCVVISCQLLSLSLSSPSPLKPTCLLSKTFVPLLQKELNVFGSKCVSSLEFYLCVSVCITVNCVYQCQYNCVSLSPPPPH